MASPTPSTQTGVWQQLRATSGDATTTAPPPSVMTQQSGRCRGEEIMREFTMSATVMGSRNRASGFIEACLRIATATSANCSEVVPYRCMCRWAIMAYRPTVVRPYSSSKLSGDGSRRGCP